MTQKKEEVKKTLAEIKFEEEKNKIREFLKKVCNPNCSHCHGIGQKGFNIITKEFVICQCVRKNYKKYNEQEKINAELKEQLPKEKEHKNIFQKISGLFKKNTLEEKHESGK